MKEKPSTTPFPVDSSMAFESGGAGAASILGGLDDDHVSWPSDGEMTVLRVKARGQSILGDGGHLCWPAGPRVQRPIPPSDSTVVSPEGAGSLVNLAAPAVDLAPDGEATLVPLSSWSTKSVTLSDSMPVPKLSPYQLPTPSVEIPDPETDSAPHTETIEAESSRPASPRPSFWQGVITRLCCGGGSSDDDKPCRR